MDDKAKLVTLAIHSFEKALALQQELAANNIDSIIQHVGDSIVTRNVRVRIKEADLDRATSVVEQIELKKASTDDSSEAPKKVLLVPIDFSDFSLRICGIAFKFAQSYGCSVRLFHAFIDPTPHVNLIEEMLTREKGKRDKALQEDLDRIQVQKENFDKQLQALIADGTLPNINYKYVVKMGIPEDEILNYSRESNVQLIVMGTRTKAEVDSEEMGSITAEVLERSENPVFALPKNADFESFNSMKNLVYATRFEDDDLMAFDRLMTLLKPFKFKVHFLHLAKGKKSDEDKTIWNEIKLRGISEYFKTNYPEQEISLNLLNGEESLLAIEQYVKDENIDVVSLTTHHRSLFVRLFNPSTAKTLLGNSKTPLLVFHV